MVQIISSLEREFIFLEMMVFGLGSWMYLYMFRDSYMSIKLLTLDSNDSQMVKDFTILLVSISIYPIP